MRGILGGIVVAGLACALGACGEDSPGSDFWSDAVDAVSPEVGDCVIHADRDCSNMDLSGGDLSGGSAHASNFSGANLSNADLSDFSADAANFSGANLSNATLDGMDVVGADFTNATLDGAHGTNVGFNDIRCG